MKRKIDSESLPLKNWKKEAAMFQDDYTAGVGCGVECFQGIHPIWAFMRILCRDAQR